MPTHNWTVTAASGGSYADAGVTGPKDFDVQNRTASPVEYVVEASAPANTFLGWLLEGGQKEPVKLAAGEKLWLRLGPRGAFTTAYLVAKEVP